MVTPTLGLRPHLLEGACRSLIEQATTVHHILVAPERPAGCVNHDFTWVPDPGRGLTAAVNVGVRTNTRPEYVLWLNDDDFLFKGGLDALVHSLDARPDAPAAIGRAMIVDPDGRPLMTSPSPLVVASLLRWGPGAMFMPSVLLRRSALNSVGALDESLLHAADLDLMLRLRRLGRFASCPARVAAFRWHSDSLTVSDAAASLREAELVRARQFSGVELMSFRAWAPIARLLTRTAKLAVTKHSNAGRVI